MVLPVLNPKAAQDRRQSGGCCAGLRGARWLPRLQTSAGFPGASISKWLWVEGRKHYCFMSSNQLDPVLGLECFFGWGEVLLRRKGHWFLKGRFLFFFPFKEKHFSLIWFQYLPPCIVLDLVLAKGFPTTATVSTAAKRRPFTMRHAVLWQEINKVKICSHHPYIYHHNQQSKARPGFFIRRLQPPNFLLWKAA